jgi:hypothetical protein
MKKLGLKISRPYRNVCGVYYRLIIICNLIKDLKFSLTYFPDVSLLMDVVVIDIFDVWGMSLSREWDKTLIGSLQMYLSYTNIPHHEGGFFALYREPVV